MKKTKVLLIGQTPPPVGGQAVIIGTLVNAEYGSVEILPLRMGYSQSLSEIGRFNARKLTHFFGLLFQAIYLIATKRPDVVHYPPCNGVHRFPLLRDILFLCVTRTLFPRRKWVFVFHSAGLCFVADRMKGIKKYFFRRAFYGADAGVKMTAFNPPDPETLEAKTVAVIPCGVRDEGPAPIDPDQDTIDLLYLGLIGGARESEMLLNVFARLAKTEPRLRLTCAGEFQNEAIEARMKATVDAQGLQDRVAFPGVITGDEKTKVLRECDIFCFPTRARYESFGIVVAEAMMYARPVVASRWYGVQELVEHEQTGLLTDPGSEDAFAEALERLILDPDLRRAMGQRGRERYLERFTVDKMITGYEDLFRETAKAS